MKRRFVIDIDGVICSQEEDYTQAIPNYDVINYFNNLYDEGNEIVYFTARGTVTGIDWREITELQFKKWGVKYNELHFGKPNGDVYIDDRAMNSELLNTEYIEKTFTSKPWGMEKLLFKDRYAAKILTIHKRQNTSLQYHVKKKETMVVLKGFGKIIIDRLEYYLYPGKVISINPKQVHQVKASFFCGLKIFECSSTELDDVVRITRRCVI